MPGKRKSRGHRKDRLYVGGRSVSRNQHAQKDLRDVVLIILIKMDLVGNSELTEFRIHWSSSEKFWVS